MIGFVGEGLTRPMEAPPALVNQLSPAETKIQLFRSLLREPEDW
jgi:hypothetical protein